MNKDDSKYNTDPCFTVQITLSSDVKLTFRQYIHNTQGHHYTSSCNWYHLYTRQTLYRPQISSLNVIPKFSARSCIFEDRAMSRKIDSGDSLKEVEKDLMLWGWDRGKWKAGSHQEFNPGSMAWAVNVLTNVKGKKLPKLCYVHKSSVLLVDIPGSSISSYSTQRPGWQKSHNIPECPNIFYFEQCPMSQMLNAQAVSRISQDVLICPT